MYQVGDRVFSGSVARRVIAGLLWGIWSVAGAGQGQALDPGLPEYLPSAQFEGGLLFVQVSEGLVSLVERLGRDLEHLNPDIELRLLVASEAALLPKAHVDLVALTMSPRLGKNPPEVAALRRRWGGEPAEVDLGYDALVVVAAKKDPVVERGLSLTELGSLYAKGPVGGEWRIRSWRQLDGPRIHRDVAEIRRVAPQADVPIMAAFREEVLLDEELDPQVKLLSDPTQIAPWVVSHEGALGVTARSAWHDKGALVPLYRVQDPARIDPTPPIEPTAQAIRSLDYALISPLSLYVERRDGRLATPVREWVAFLLSRQGQAILADAGYVALSAERALAQRQWLGVE